MAAVEPKTLASPKTSHPKETLAAQAQALGFTGFRRQPIIRRPVIDLYGPDEEKGSLPLRKPPPHKVGFEYAEHDYISDSLWIYTPDGGRYSSGTKPFNLPNGLVLSMGQISALAGDFYGTYYPICEGATLDQQIGRFQAAVFQLAQDTTRQPSEANALISALRSESDAIRKALISGVNDPSTIYATLPDLTPTLERITYTRPSSVPGYLGLALINFDHFGEDARTAYVAGHCQAIRTAAAGDLNWAYIQEAFALHFLEDSFSAGHVRTPRRALHSASNPSYDVCAKFMHDEENAIGLRVYSDNDPKGWNMYGDKRLFDGNDWPNYYRCLNALQSSVAEIYNAFKTRQILQPAQMSFHAFVPSLSLARINQNLSMLFKEVPGQELNRRSTITDRWNRENKYTTNWWAATTATMMKADGWWTFPIVMDGPGHAYEYDNLLPGPAPQAEKSEETAPKAPAKTSAKTSVAT